MSTATPIDTTYSYYDSERGDGYTTTKLKSETIDGVTYTYEYDTLGNITDIYRGDTHLYYYEYDAMNQLIYVRDYENAKIYTYTYDTAGNLIAENISDVNSNGSAYNTVHKSYQYTDTNWGDKLTSYDGQTITYDAIGNPLTYRDGMTMTWKNGRQLATLQDSDDTISYEYDSSSIRTSKTVDGVKHTYAYLGGKLMYETRGDAKFYYSYDANGILYSVKYTLTDSSDMLTYFFTHNSRGDIIGIYSDTGVLSAKYEYDAWGNILSITDSNGIQITSDTHIANLNPFRYRGYYYDSETGLYYLMSRYYDPVTHRFINADGYISTGQNLVGNNMFAYCGNDPINRVDDEGEFWHIVAGAAIGGFLSAGIELVSQIMSGEDELDWASIGIEFVSGAASGALTTCGMPPVAYCAVSGVIGATTSGLHSFNNGDDALTIAKNSLVGGLASTATSFTGEKLKSIGRKVTSAKHMKWGAVGNKIKEVSNSKTSKPSIVKEAIPMGLSFVQKANAPTKSTSKYCRGCCRPIGNQYSWQCSNPWSL